MNYLAHLFLAGDSPQSMVGSILGDFVKGAIGDKYPQGVKSAIELHRKIDAYTDSHSTTLASRNLFGPDQRRFAGIIVDLCYDHFLCRHWLKFADVALTEFISRAYGILRARKAMLPKRLRAIMPIMIREDWLGSYRGLVGVELTLGRLSKRVTHGHRLPGAIEEIKLHYRKLDANFLMFFPDLEHFVHQVKSGGQFED
jgi:acyl carrier protein phosphodiesterase